MNNSKLKPWFKNATINEMADMVKHLKKGNLKSWYDKQIVNTKCKFSLLKEFSTKQIDVIEDFIV